MWHASLEELPGMRQRYRWRSGDRPLAYSTVLALWQSDRHFRTDTTRLLAASPYPAYFWETPALTAATADRPFEFVATASTALAAVSPDPHSFQEHFAAAGTAAIACFRNLGGDARLLAPCPQAAPEAYPHLAAFCRSGPADQQQALWQAVGQVALELLGDRPLWLSTSGLGVAWLHLRLDARPKYYSYAPYRCLPG